jgi:hypothetical protein
MHTKIFVIAVIVIIAGVFGIIFWNQFSENQEDLANPNTYTDNSNPANVSGSASVDEIESDLDSIDLDFDSNSAEMQTESSRL